MLQNLFTVPIWRKELNLNLNNILKSCKHIEKNNKSREISNRGGYQSQDIDKSNYSELDELLVLSEKEANLFANELKIKQVKVSNCWLNINGYKDFNIPHTHSFCLLAGVFYVKTPKDCGHISFFNPAKKFMEYDWCKSNINEWNENTSHSWWMPVQENILYIFPSWLEHNVYPNQNKKEKRISIALNYVIQQ